nr:amidase [Rhodococcus wratislaviensis]GLK39058.1 amidase [Rhodococcus wratislaviensis]
MDDIVRLEATELSAAIAARRVSCREVMTAYLDHIEAVNPTINAIVALQPRDELLRQATERDQELRQGRARSWMHGFPHAVKDITEVRGISFTAGSPIYANRIGATDDPVVRRIRDAGAVIVGKTNTPELGLGSQTYNPVWGTTVNPYDTTRTAGGSSGGAAAALAARMLPVADGSDYMGSLRNPAAFTNVIGFRPSFGRIPKAGFIAQLSTLGPMGRTVTDVARLLEVMQGAESHAPLALNPGPEVASPAPAVVLTGTRIAWVGDLGGHLAFEGGLLELCTSSLRVFEDLGCTIEHVVPDFDFDELWDAFLVWRWWHSVELHEIYDDCHTRAMLKPETVWEIEHGLALDARRISQACRVRNRWYQVVAQLFDRYDFVIAPTTQVFPFDATQHWPPRIGDRTMDTYHRWMETVAPWSLTGHPVLALPAGFDTRGLPSGIQLIGPARQDTTVLRAGFAYEQHTQWVQRRPPTRFDRSPATGVP